MKRKMRSGARHYRFREEEILCCLVKVPCKHCGLVQISIRKVFFAENVHFEKLCSGCLRHSDYLPRHELSWALDPRFASYSPIGSSGCEKWKVNSNKTKEKLENNSS